MNRLTRRGCDSRQQALGHGLFFRLDFARQIGGLGIAQFIGGRDQ